MNVYCLYEYSLRGFSYAIARKMFINVNSVATKVIIVSLCWGIFANSLPLDFLENDGSMLCDLERGEPCLINEACVSKSGDPKIGTCECVEGMMRNVSRSCVPTTNISVNSNAQPDVVSRPSGDSSPKLPGSTSMTVDFDVDGPPSVRLPADEAILRVFLVSPSPDNHYSYHWERIDGNGSATANSYNEPSLILTKLREGKMVFQVKVSNETHSGSKQYVLTILPQILTNKPPRAIIRPESPVKGIEGSQLVLDAEGSRDEGKILSFVWSQDEGPSIALPALTTAILRLDHLVKGDYQFTVVVTDEEGLSSNTSAKVVVSAERDDPPKARITRCGYTDMGSITVRLPMDDLELCGNASTDDKGVQSYNWFRVDKLATKLPVDSAGSSSSILVLTNIHENDQLGPYIFELVVEDAKGQKDSSRISIFVNKAENLVPVVDAGGNHTLLLPETSIVLDGAVKDDGSIISYQWKQISGPSLALLSNSDNAKATVSGLTEGDYVFTLTVLDDGGLNGTDTAYIFVQRSKNDPPEARAANITAHLPSRVAVLNGSLSVDDAGIVSYLWEPFDDVPAAMTALDGSDRQAVMFIAGLVKGIHYYHFTVTDQQKASNTITVELAVDQGEEDLESVEVIIEKPLNQWTYRLRSKLSARLASVLAGSIKEVNKVYVHFSNFEEIPRDGRLRATFWAQTDTQAVQMRRRRSMTTSSGVLKAAEASHILMQEKSMLREFEIVKIQPLYCKLDCSGHGSCSDSTKECTCDRFWMTSLFTLMGNEWQHIDCAWSSVYFFMLSLGAGLGLTICILFRRRSPLWGRVTRRRLRRRKRYSALNTDSDEEVRRIRAVRVKDKLSDGVEYINEPRLQPLPLPPSSDSLHSESDDLLNDNSWEMDSRTRP